MNDILFQLLGVYLVLGITWGFCSATLGIMEKNRLSARCFFLTPVWPVAAAYLLWLGSSHFFAALKEVGEIAELDRIASKKEERTAGQLSESVVGEVSEVDP